MPRFVAQNMYFLTFSHMSARLRTASLACSHHGTSGGSTKWTATVANGVAHFAPLHQPPWEVNSLLRPTSGLSTPT